MSWTETILGLCAIAEEQLHLIRELALRLSELGCISAVEAAEMEEKKWQDYLGEAPGNRKEN